MKPIAIAAVVAVIGLAGYFAASAWLKQEPAAAGETTEAVVQTPDVGRAPDNNQMQVRPLPRASTQLHELPATNVEGISPPRPQDQSVGAN